jgi:hypothetical protein
MSLGLLLRGRRWLARPGFSLEDQAQLAGEVIQMVVQFAQPVTELKYHLHAGQVDAQVAVKAHDAPEPTNLGRLIAFDRAVPRDLDQPELLVPE